MTQTTRTITLFHNPRCSKSRQALQLLQDNGIEPQLRLYLDNPPNRTELTLLLQRLGINARQLLRTGEQDYQDCRLDNTELSEADLIEAMTLHPKLIERPIAICAKRAVIGRPPENVLDLI